MVLSLFESSLTQIIWGAASDPQKTQNQKLKLAS